jgi:hypothetical protein
LPAFAAVGIDLPFQQKTKLRFRQRVHPALLYRKGFVVRPLKILAAFPVIMVVPMAAIHERSGDRRREKEDAGVEGRKTGSLKIWNGGGEGESGI